MKKKLLLICPIVAIAVVIYSFSVHGQASESAEDSFERYYNTDDSYGETTTTYREDKNSSATNSDVTQSPTDLPDSEEPHAVDTDINSITILVNKSYMLDTDYEPDDLVVPNIKFSMASYDPKMQLRQEAATAMENLFDAAMQNGLELVGVSGYRSYKRQFEIYASNLIKRGQTFTDQYSAYPGTSEHQTGLAMDISTSSIGNRLTDEFANTPEGIWVEQNCYKYGFIVRFQADKTDVTGYAYEPWHIRYVGVELATYLTEHNLTLDEYYGYVYKDVIHPAIDYNAIIQQYYAMKGMINVTSQPTATAPADVDDFESLEEDLVDDEEITESGENAEESREETHATTSKPTDTPTPTPTKKPTHATSEEPTKEPTEEPTQEPTKKPTTTPEPENPTDAPTPEVTTPEPTVEPTVTPEPTTTEEPASDTPSPTSTEEIETTETVTEGTEE